MSVKKKKKNAKLSVFDSVRKPTAPPTRRFGKPKPDERVNPTGRKTKHKRKDDLES